MYWTKYIAFWQLFIKLVLHIMKQRTTTYKFLCLCNLALPVQIIVLMTLSLPFQFSSHCMAVELSMWWPLSLYCTYLFHILSTSIMGLLQCEVRMNSYLRACLEPFLDYFVCGMVFKFVLNPSLFDHVLIFLLWYEIVFKLTWLSRHNKWQL